MKRFKEMATIFLFALLAAGFTSSAMAASGSDSPWDLIFRVHGFFANYNPLILCNYRHLLVSIAGINKSIVFQ
ncbi:hypothetical protein [Salmonella enterica]|uniref:hypothetical protein n=1 Tax=Salmonella enterica TaxID=28901 RepID=UPI0035266746